MDRIGIYSIIYSLAASGGRESVLFGNSAAAAFEAFSRSLAGEAFPEIWFEIPLAGKPWFDLHLLVARENLVAGQSAFSGQGGVYADALNWFAEQEKGMVRQLALSYDSNTGDVDNPAVQLLMNGRDISIPFGFLDAVGRAEAKDAYRTFVESMAAEWYNCYIGAFPRRQADDVSQWVRAECIVDPPMQEVYADDAAAISEHLARVGISNFDDDMLCAFHELARSPFPLEFQFNVGSDGKVLPVVSASVRFQPADWLDPSRREHLDDLLRKVQDMGLADDRIEPLANTAFAKHMARGSESIHLYCYPAFVKLRWSAGEPASAKAYLIAGAQ